MVVGLEVVVGLFVIVRRVVVVGGLLVVVILALEVVVSTFGVVTSGVSKVVKVLVDPVWTFPSGSQEDQDDQELDQR